MGDGNDEDYDEDEDEGDGDDNDDVGARERALRGGGTEIALGARERALRGVGDTEIALAKASGDDFTASMLDDYADLAAVYAGKPNDNPNAISNHVVRDEASVGRKIDSLVDRLVAPTARDARDRLRDLTTARDAISSAMTTAAGSPGQA